MFRKKWRCALQVAKEVPVYAMPAHAARGQRVLS